MLVAMMDYCTLLKMEGPTGPILRRQTLEMAL